MTSPTPVPFSRRQWLKAAGAALAGAAVALRLRAAPPALNPVQLAPDATGRPAAPREPRRYVHGFEPEPGA